MWFHVGTHRTKRDEKGKKQTKIKNQNIDKHSHVTLQT